MDTQKLYKWNSQQDMNIGILDDPKELQEAKALDNALMQKHKMDEIGKDIYESNAINDVSVDASLIQDKRQNVEANMPESVSVFSMKRSLISEGKYTFLSGGTFKKAKRTAPSGKYMQPILDNLAKLDRLFEKEFDVKDQEAIHNGFRDAILSCEKYISNRNPWTAEGKARLQMVKDFQKQLQTESIQFEDRMQELADESDQADQMQADQKKVAKKKTWLDILSKVRTEEIENGKNGYEVEIGGEGSSKVYIIKKDGKKRFFKENEKMPSSSFYEYFRDEKKMLSKNNDEKSIRRKGYLDIIHKAMLMKYATESEAYHKFAGLTSNVDKFKERLIKVLSWDNKFKKMIGEINEEDSKYVFDVLIQGTRNMTLSNMCIDKAMIDKGAEISKRNVATSRMAKMLGLENLVTKSSLVNLKFNGKTMQGISMEEAEGEEFQTIRENAEKGKKRKVYTTECFRKLLNLQVFDIICGQVDRNATNYFGKVTQTDNKTVMQVEDIKGIDNDTSFGNLTYKDVVKKGFGDLHALVSIESDGKLTAPYMDEELANSILKLDAKIINYTMCDILSKNERNALIDRIEGLKKLINKTRAKEQRLRSKKKKVNSVFIKDDKESWNKAFSDYKTQFRKKHIENPERADNGVFYTTYLKPDFLQEK